MEMPVETDGTHVQLATAPGWHKQHPPELKPRQRLPEQVLHDRANAKQHALEHVQQFHEQVVVAETEQLTGVQAERLGEAA